MWTFSPIVERELRIHARRARTYWARLPLPLTLTLIFTLILLNASDRIPPTEMGKAMFQVAVWFALAYCVLSGLRSTGDCISSEKREGTLGFLFLTDLKGHDIILGKLIPNSIIHVTGLVSLMPVLVIPLLLGGVSVTLVAKVGITLMAAMFLSLTVGMLCSTVGRQEQFTVGSALGIMILLVGVFPFVAAILEENSERYESLVTLLRVFSPGYACWLASISAGKHADLWPWSLGGMLALGSLALVLASLLVGRLWQEKVPSTLGFRLRTRLGWILYGRSDTRRAFRRQWLEVNPIAWLALRNRLRLWVGWLILAGSLAFWIFLRLGIGTKMFAGPTSEVILFLLLGLIKMAMASESGVVFSRDIRNGAMELVLTTRLSVPEVLAGQCRALRKMFQGLLAGLAAFTLGLLIVALVVSSETSGPDKLDRAWYLLIAIPILLADLYTLAWVGMWMGVASKNPRNAASEAFFRVLLLPHLALGAVSASVGMSNLLLHTHIELGFEVFLALYVILSLLVDYYWYRHAQDCLVREFRQYAYQRYEPDRPLSFWGRIGRTLGTAWAKRG